MRLAVLLVLTFPLTLLAGPDKTWRKVGGKLYGAKADKTGPIGGGKGYTKVITQGDYTVKTLDQLLNTLKKAKAGEVIFLPGQVDIDCTVRVHIEKLVLKIPAGVTLASNRGHKGSPGARIFSDKIGTLPLIHIAGKSVRITGLRLQGPTPRRHLEHHRRSFREGRGRKYYYKFPVSRGIETKFAGLEVDNCELSGWSHAAIYLRQGKGHHIHHNFIHHNQYNGLGYGVCHNKAESLIEFNLFNYNRHSIAGTGRTPSGYEARHNVEMGVSLSHCFDMHGGRDRKDGTNIAGTWMKVHHNTFLTAKWAVVVRGVPEVEVLVTKNWFYQRRPKRAVRGEKGTRVEDNLCGRKKPRVR